MIDSDAFRNANSPLTLVLGQDIAGEAHGAMQRAQEYAATAEAMRGVVQGFGDAYIVPTYTLLDDLAADFGHTEAGACLKRAREVTRADIRALLGAAWRG